MGNIFGDDDEKEIQRMRKQLEDERKRKEAEDRERNRKAIEAYEKGVREAAADSARKYQMSGGKKGGLCGATYKKHGKKFTCTKKKGHWFGHG